MFLKCISIKFPKPSFDIKDVNEISGFGSWLTVKMDYFTTSISLSDYRVVVFLEPFGLPVFLMEVNNDDPS